MKTKLPSALVYGWNRFGLIKEKSNLLKDENLSEDVVIYSYETDDEFESQFVEHQPDVIITFGDKNSYKILQSHKNQEFISSKWFHYNNLLDYDDLYDKIAIHSTNWSCSSTSELYGSKSKPYFSAFTGVYKTGERIYRTYSGLKHQTYPNWEWVVIDDSPADDFDTWNMLEDIASKDHRVKIYRIHPNSGGNVGEVKHRAAMMSNGDWLLELDHDDHLASTYFEECVKGINAYPDAGFIYTGCAEIYENGEHKQYGPIDPKGYGKPGYNDYVWSYAQHEWVVIDGKKYIGGALANINPKTIRYNMGMPNHARMWRRDIYNKVRGHNRTISVADDFELIVKTFLVTRMLKIDKVLYMQWNDFNSTVDNNLKDINRRARLIRNYYDKAIHDRILELGKFDWDWNEETQSCNHTWWMDYTRYHEREQVLNYIYK